MPGGTSAPAACGELVAAPEDGIEAGHGGAAGEGVNTGLLSVGGALVAAATGGLFAMLVLRRGNR